MTQIFPYQQPSVSGIPYNMSAQVKDLPFLQKHLQRLNLTRNIKSAGGQYIPEFPSLQNKSHNNISNNLAMMSYKFGTPNTFASNKRSSTSQRPRDIPIMQTGQKQKRNKTPGVGAKRANAHDKIYWQVFQPVNYLQSNGRNSGLQSDLNFDGRKRGSSPFAYNQARNKIRRDTNQGAIQWQYQQRQQFNLNDFGSRRFSTPLQHMNQTSGGRIYERIYKDLTSGQSGLKKHRNSQKIEDQMRQFKSRIEKDSPRTQYGVFGNRGSIQIDRRSNKVIKQQDNISIKTSTERDSQKVPNQPLKPFIEQQMQGRQRNVKTLTLQQKQLEDYQTYQSEKVNQSSNVQEISNLHQQFSEIYSSLHTNNQNYSRKKYQRPSQPQNLNNSMRIVPGLQLNSISQTRKNHTLSPHRGYPSNLTQRAGNNLRTFQPLLQDDDQKQQRKIVDSARLNTSQSQLARNNRNIEAITHRLDNIVNNLQRFNLNFQNLNQINPQLKQLATKTSPSHLNKSQDIDFLSSQLSNDTIRQQVIIENQKYMQNNERNYMHKNQRNNLQKHSSNNDRNKNIQPIQKINKSRVQDQNNIDLQSDIKFQDLTSYGSIPSTPHISQILSGRGTISAGFIENQQLSGIVVQQQRKSNKNTIKQYDSIEKSDSVQNSIEQQQQAQGDMLIKVNQNYSQKLQGLSYNQKQVIIKYINFMHSLKPNSKATASGIRKIQIKKIH